MKKDREFYKKKYQGTWIDGNKREELVKNFLEGLGLKVQGIGFMVMSTEYTSDSPEEKNIPDFSIRNGSGEEIKVEVTGTNYMSLEEKIWISKGKIDYAKKHKDIDKVYVAHVISEKKLLRFVDVTNIEVNQLEGIRPYIHDHFFPFYAIPFRYVISEEKMSDFLLNWKNGFNEINNLNDFM